MEESAQPARNGSSGPGLTACLVESDQPATARARRARRRALLVSVALEVAALGVLVLWPVLATRGAPRLRLLTPLPPYGDPQAGAHPGSQMGGSRREPARKLPLDIFQPPVIPQGAESLVGDSRAGDVSGAGEGPSWGVLQGVVPPSGNMDPSRLFSAPVKVEAPAERRPPLRRSEGVQQGLLIHRLEPVYPPLARQIRLEGVVRLHAIIGTDGTMRSLELVSGHPILAQAAIEGVRRWRYRPTLLNGEPVEVETRITVVFQLQR